MSILAQRLDPRIEAGAERRIVHPSRTKAYSADGKITQTFPSARIKHIFDVSLGVRTQADYQQVLGAFYAILGTPYDGLLFKDWADYQATQTNSTLTLISGSDYQLQRVYAFNVTYTYLRKITRPVSGVTVYRTRSSVVTTATASIDTATGIATISGHVAGDTYTWEGEFLVPVTFARNDWSATLEVNTSNLHLINGSIELEEIFE